MAESDIEHGFGREAALVATGAVDADLMGDVEAILREDGESDTSVQVVILRSAE